MNDLFIIKNPYKSYASNRVEQPCSSLDCESLKVCKCSLCTCCSVCADQCSCPYTLIDQNEKVASILGFGDDNYRYTIIMLMLAYLYSLRSFSLVSNKYVDTTIF